jgi:hypothetical protein
MSIGAVLLLLIVGGVATTFTIVTVHFNMRRRKVAEAALAATQGQIDRIYSLFESAGGETPADGILVEDKGVPVGAGSFICIPRHIPDFLWAGRVSEVRVNEGVEIVLSLHEPSSGTGFVTPSLTFLRCLSETVIVNYLQIMPRLVDQDVYLASESSFYRTQQRISFIIGTAR